MTSPLNIDSFEHFFDEKILKSGLSLYQRKQIRTADKLAGGEYTFTFKGKNTAELSLKKRNNKILRYTCSCNKKNCKHICAAIFYFIKDKLLLNESKLLKSPEIKKRGSVRLEQSCEKLKDLIQQSAESNQNKKPGMGLISSILQQFFEQNKKNDEVILHLCVINEFSNFLSFKDVVNETKHSNAVNASINFLECCSPAELSELQKEAWLSATKKSLSNNKKFSSGSYSILTPLAANIIKEKIEFEDLRLLLNKRSLKQNYNHYLDQKLIAQFELQIKEAEILHKTNSAFLKDISPELSAAKAELKFSLKKNAEGFKIIRADYEKIKKIKTINFINYIEYAIERAHKYNSGENEIYFIKEIMLNDYQVSPEHLKRIKVLIPGTGREKFINEIIRELKRKSPEIYFDKVAAILESERRFDELIHLISKQSNKFSLLSRIAIKKFPLYDNFLLENYIKQFVNAVSEARETFHQKQIFDKALVYMEQLPKEAEAKIVFQMLEKISKSNFVYRLLKKLSESLLTTEGI
jgi:hypothetical protein